MIYNAADNTDVMVLNLFHAGFPVRRNAAGNIAVKITGWWKDIPADLAECQHDHELIRDGLMLTAAGDRYLYMLGVVEGVYKAQERVKTAFEVSGGNL